MASFVHLRVKSAYSLLEGALPVKKIIAITRAAGRGVQHLAADCIGALQSFQPLGGAASAFGCAAEVEDEQ